ncbi:RNA polymerase sigma factor, sigma-70 family [Streptomyces atratus]|uniref:RNA polymerase sigma factor, sigma-70 family n=1 Tax=Streptomyces atratus TaxID=1893 RepID=A0A1K1TM15_STRAR|nr:RNA polymerase sigma factor, sigma-70 family [Streptomyces atratus]
MARSTVDGPAGAPVRLRGVTVRCWTHSAIVSPDAGTAVRPSASHHASNALRSGQREMAVDEVMAEAMEALWKQRKTLKTPERAMYRMAERMAWRRFPHDPREAPADLLETEKAMEDPIDALVDRILVEEELAKLPEKTRQYLYDHKALGKTAEKVAADYGVPKGTVTQNVRRSLEKCGRPSTACASSQPSRSSSGRSATGSSREHTARCLPAIRGSPAGSAIRTRTPRPSRACSTTWRPSSSTSCPTRHGSTLATATTPRSATSVRSCRSGAPAAGETGRTRPPRVR